MSQLTTKISQLVENTCKSETNIYGYSAWTHHITSVVTFAKQLAEKMHADVEIVELAALFHDYASVLDKKLYPEHHIHSARLAREVLERYGYPQERIAQIEHCILAHRGSRDIQRKTVEAEILASADAMAHFSNLDSLFSLAFKVKRLEVGEGREFVMNKLGRSWKKLLPEARELVAPQYQAAKTLFEKNDGKKNE